MPIMKGRRRGFRHRQNVRRNGYLYARRPLTSQELAELGYNFGVGDHGPQLGGACCPPCANGGPCAGRRGGRGAAAPTKGELSAAHRELNQRRFKWSGPAWINAPLFSSALVHAANAAAIGKLEESERDFRYAESLAAETAGQVRERALDLLSDAADTIGFGPSELIQEGRAEEKRELVKMAREGSTPEAIARHEREMRAIDALKEGKIGAELFYGVGALGETGEAIADVGVKFDPAAVIPDPAKIFAIPGMKLYAGLAAAGLGLWIWSKL